MSVRTYSPSKVNFIFAGTELTGFAEDDFIEVEPLGEGIKSVSGPDGEVARALDPDTRVKVTLKLTSASAGNDTLTAQYKLDQSTGSGIAPLLIKDLSGTTLLSAAQAWVTKLPKTTKGKEVGTTEWELETGPADFTVGGNETSGIGSLLGGIFG